jgi:excisionase family DNA binding protein
MKNTVQLQSKEQTAGLLGVSLQTLNRMVLRGELIPTKIGKSVKFKPEDIDAYLNRQSKPVFQTA